ncbi:unnamed protein product [Prorocentrum cordatum]|uniref:Uncharacterized protein n=1 Tax=Prorocentrum cordatum TaxID=2364126 RepID=A0ABN9RFW5_9DINO|nr:unnamed protein product [Polarella glacialis]
MFTCGSLSTAGMAASADLLSVAKKAANFRNRLASKQAEGQRRELLDKERSHEDQLREVCRRCRRVGQQVAMEFGDELWTVGGEDPCTVHFNRNPREFVLPAVKTLTGLVVSEADTGSDIERAVDLKTSLRAVENCLVEEARERIANREKGKSYESLQRANKTAMAFDGLVRELASLLGQPADATPEAPQPAAEALGHEPPEVPGAGTQRSAARASLARSSEPPEVRRAGTRRSGARSSVARSSLARSSLGESSLFEVFGEEDSEAESGLEGEARALLPGVGAQKASGSASPSAAASTWGSGRVEAEENCRHWSTPWRARCCRRPCSTPGRRPKRGQGIWS